MEKVIRDGKVAVIISPGYGAGWYSWHGYEELLFHPKLVELVEQGRRGSITEKLCLEILGNPKDAYMYLGGAHQLVIEWVPVGTPFRIDEYDGSESLVTDPTNLVA